MCYRFLKPLLFCLPPETAHYLTLKALKLMSCLHLTQTPSASPCLAKTVLGLPFPNPIGLAAGLDKNGDYIDALAKLGFGFIEVGTVTPRPQRGNPKPRLFRFPKQQALINRMGFNNKGIDHLVEKVKHLKYQGILGINIGKNASTPIEEAVQDYVTCFKKAYPYASYITVNISSPNTSGLRQLQHGEFLIELLSTLKTAQVKLTASHKKYVPLLVKIAPDLTEDEVATLAHTVKEFHIDGIIATNTTLERFDLKTSETGGLSGAPLEAHSMKILKLLKQAVGEDIPIISAGGIMTPACAKARLDAGASLVQLYTGLVYQGPSLLTQCINTLSQQNQN